MHEFSRIKRLPPYVFNITAELKMAARRRGEDIIDLSMGNPDGPTPQHIVDKLVEAAQREDTHGYSVSKGIPRLRKAICDWYMRRYDVEFDPESEAIVTIGSKEGLAHLMLATLERGDTVLVPNPSYPIHIYGAIIAGADIRSVRMTPGVDFFEETERAIRELIPKPKMLVLGFPSNPTAMCVDLEFFERIIALAKKHDILVVHDLAYADITFEDYKAPSIMQVPGARDVAVEFFTMSKSYNMAGWRIGFMVGNKELVHALARMKSYHDYGTFAPIQIASIVALEGPQDCVEEVRLKYQKRRDVVVKGLHDIGWMVENPKASMYVWAKIPEFYAKLGSLEFAKKLLQDAKIAVSPGIGFGDYGDDHVRIALIENEHRLRQAVRGIREMFKKDGLIK
ncbi:MAG: alanine transaminase [Betaproteobacteria bacterium]|nr:alanine transaminase [Betaproteobacteria bacterium]